MRRGRVRGRPAGGGEAWGMHEVCTDEAVLFLDSGVVVGRAGERVIGIVVIITPFGLHRLVEVRQLTRYINLTKWFANSRPGTFAFEYSKSMTTSCLCWFAGRRSGDSPSGFMRRILPY